AFACSVRNNRPMKQTQLKTRRTGSVVAFFVVLNCSLLIAVAGTKPSHPTNSKADPSQEQGATDDGRQLFATRCAGCHGLDGKGGERAPDIATSAKTLGRSDEELFRIVDKGLPGTGMPAFASLGNGGIKDTVAHLRSLQGRTTTIALPGDGKRGRATFYGKGRCADCHMV